MTRHRKASADKRAWRRDTKASWFASETAQVMRYPLGDIVLQLSDRGYVEQEGVTLPRELWHYSGSWRTYRCCETATNRYAFLCDATPALLSGRATSLDDMVGSFQRLRSLVREEERTIFELEGLQQKLVGDRGKRGAVYFVVGAQAGIVTLLCTGVPLLAAGAAGAIIGTGFLNGMAGIGQRRLATAYDIKNKNRGDIVEAMRQIVQNNDIRFGNDAYEHL